MNTLAGLSSPRHSGRSLLVARAVALPASQPLVSDLKLFAMTYAAGFVAVTLFIA